MENLQNMQNNAAGNLDDMQTRLQNEQEVIATLRDELSTFNEELSTTTAAIKEAQFQEHIGGGYAIIRDPAEDAWLWGEQDW